MEIRAHALSSPIDPPQERRFHGGVRRLLKRDAVIAIVETPDGEQGYAPAGASSSAMREFFEGDSHQAFAELLEGRVADALNGITIDGTESIESAHDALDDLDLPPKLGAEVAATVDVALYDLVGKRQGAPIHKLLGDDSAPTTDLDLYASAGMYMEPEGYAAQAKTLDDCGFVGYKYRPGIGPAGDRRIVEEVTDAAGPEMDVMVDAHTWWKTGGETYDTETVRELVAHAHDNGAFWIEEPVAPDDHEAYVSLAEATGAPLAGGESEPTPDGLLALARTGGVSFLQGDVRHHAGYTGCWGAVEFCCDSDVRYVPHHFGTLLGLVANAHLVAAGGTLLEYPVFEDDPALDTDDTDDPGMYPFPLAFDVLDDALDVDDGQLSIPDGPGLGVDLNPDVVESYPYVEGPWTEFVYDE